MELVDELAFPVPFQVISDLLGMPTEREARAARWSQTLTAALEPTADEDDARRRRGRRRRSSAYLDEIIDDRRQHLGDDLLSQLLAVEEAGDRLTPAELISFVVLLYVAGHETTVNLIGNGMLALLRHPDQLRRWRDDPSLDATAVDELLRFDGPVQHTVRDPACSRCATATSRWRAGDDGADRARRSQPRPGDVRRPRRRCASTARTPAATSRSRPASTTASAPRSPSSRRPSRSRR